MASSPGCRPRLARLRGRNRRRRTSTWPGFSLRTRETSDYRSRPNKAIRKLTSVDEEDVGKGNGEAGDEGKKETRVLVTHAVEHVVCEQGRRSSEHVTEDCNSTAQGVSLGRNREFRRDRLTSLSSNRTRRELSIGVGSVVVDAVEHVVDTEEDGNKRDDGGDLSCQVEKLDLSLSRRYNGIGSPSERNRIE